MDPKVVRGRSRADYAYMLEYRSKWTDNDIYAHFNNTIYIQLIDSVINAYLIEHCGLELPRGDGTAPPAATDEAKDDLIGLAVSTSVSYVAPLAYPGVAEVCMRVHKLGKSSVTFEAAVFEKGVEGVKAVGWFTHVYVDRESRRPRSDGLGSGKMRKGLEAAIVKNAKL